jgi:hypothetical protein
MKKEFILLLVLFTGLISCHKEELTPRTNPRFSVAFIQDIDENGVQFAANVYDFGSDDILEYGFVYAEGFNPTYENAEIIKKTGKPGEFFELSARHSMVKGKEYKVAAFIKTDIGIVYSVSVTFVSKGSGGFIFEKMELPQQVYFGDTIIVYGKDFSRVAGNYSIWVSNSEASVFEVTDEFFRFILPGPFQTSSFSNDPEPLDFYIKIVEKSIVVQEMVEFKRPQINQTPLQEKDYSEIVTIEGDFLGYLNAEIEYENESGLRYTLPIIESTKNTISFQLAARFTEQLPKIMLKIKAEEFVLTNLVKLKPSELEPGQEFEIFSWEDIIVKTINPNSHSPFFNSFIGDLPESIINTSQIQGSNISLFFDGQYNPLGRQMKIHLNNVGIKSQNSVTVKFKDASLPFILVPNSFQPGYGGANRGVSVNDIGYLFRDKSVFKLNPETRELVFVTDNGQTPFDVASIFAVPGPNEKIYTASRNIFNNPGHPEFFEFDTRTERLVKLENIPTTSTYPLAVFATDKYLYYDGGFSYSEGFGYIEINDRWRYDFEKKIWEKFEGIIKTDPFIRRYIPFWYQGELYLLGQEYEGTFGVSLMKFDPVTESYPRIKELNPGGISRSNEIFVVKDNLYLFTDSGILRVNMMTLEENYVSNSAGFNTSYYNAELSFQSKDKFYIYNNSRLIWEFDPEYFTY